MRRHLKVFALAGLVAITAAACGGGGGGGGSTQSPSAGETPQKGGTLLVAMNTDVTNAFDPQKEYYQVSFAYYRCCLLRTLMSYNGLDAAHQGDQVFPDLAASEPEISSDQLRWTFHLKQGLHYAPPLQDVEITAQDFVRAMMREATPSVAAGYSFYYGVIQGFDDFASGKAKTISGMETPDNYTLVIHLTGPAGDLGYRFALPATAPIPPNPSDPSAPLGVATGHDDDYGRFLVASGPYMYSDSASLDFSKPASEQTPASGYTPGKSLTLVRNPSWAQDDLRPAYVDGINVDISPGAEGEVLDKKVESDEIDTVFANGVSPTILRDFQTNADLKDQIFVNPGSGNYYLALNLAVPPFDDINVRKAVNYAIDKDGWRKLQGGPVNGTIAGYFVPPGLEGNLLTDYNPYATPNDQGADTADGLKLAKDAMAQSKYDTNHDGLCDAPECDNVLTVGIVGRVSEAQNALIQQNLAAIGIKLDLKEFTDSAAYGKIFDPRNHIPLSTFGGWLQDYPDAYTFYFFPMYGPSIQDQYNTNYSMTGASADQLKKYGYTVTDVPGINEQIDKCTGESGDARVQCWADTDKFLMENVVPIVPLIFSNVINIVSSRVRNYTYSLFDNQTAYDHLWLAS